MAMITDPNVLSALIEEIKGIVSKDAADQEEIAEWCQEFLWEFNQDDEKAHREALLNNLGAEIERLEQMIVPYTPDPTLPPLPEKPAGQLFGIAFIYDEDKDKRILTAIDQLRDAGIIAIREHQGTFQLWSRKQTKIMGVSICDGDEWSVQEEYVPKKGGWHKSPTRSH